MDFELKKGSSISGKTSRPKDVKDRITRSAHLAQLEGPSRPVGNMWRFGNFTGDFLVKTIERAQQRNDSKNGIPKHQSNPMGSWTLSTQICWNIWIHSIPLEITP